MLSSGDKGRYEYSSNAWGYFSLGDALTVQSIAERICSLGYDGFDFSSSNSMF